MPAVRSTNISSAEYDKKKNIMTVQFLNNGAVYEYSGVPEEVYLALLNAPSAGGFLNAYVKGTYPYVRVS